MAPPLKHHFGVIVAVAIAASAVVLGHQNESATRQVTDAQLSPDGSAVLFARSGAIWRIPYSGGDEQRLTAAEPVSGRPRWSPDGTQIAFLRTPDSAKTPSRIFIMPADGGAARAITPGSIDVVAFEWSPSGRRFAFVSGGITDPGLWVVDPGGSELRRLREGLSTAFAWAPDDSAIARITSTSSGGPTPVEIVAVERTAASRALPRDVHPRVSWSRDGTLALIGRGLVPNRLLLASAPNFLIREVPVSAPANLADVVWLGNGQVSLTFVSTQESWIEHMTIATGARVNLVPPGTATLFTTPSWSRDGTRFVVVGHSESHMAEVYAGTLPLPESGRPDVVGARPPPVRRITFSDR